MNTDQLKGKLEQAIGNVKQGIGEALGDNKTANEGLGDQVKGSARETWGNVKDAASTSTTTTPTSTVHDDLAVDHTANTRETVSEKLHDAKVAVNNKIDDFKDRR